MKTKKLKFTPAYLFEEQLIDERSSVEIYSLTYEVYLFGDYVVSYKSTLKEARKDLLSIIHNFYSTDYEHYLYNYGVKNWKQFKQRFLSGSTIYKKAYFHKQIYTDSTRTQFQNYFNDFEVIGSYQGF